MQSANVHIAKVDSLPWPVNMNLIGMLLVTLNKSLYLKLNELELEPAACVPSISVQKQPLTGWDSQLIILGIFR